MKKFLLPLFKGKTQIGRVLETAHYNRPIPYDEMEDLVHKRYEFAYEFSEKWKKSGISALIMPLWPHCGMKAHNQLEWGQMVEYVAIWNALYYPCGTLPVTKVLPDEEEYKDSKNDLWTKVLADSAKGSAGMPISVQVVAHAFEDEKALAVMQAIEK